MRVVMRFRSQRDPQTGLNDWVVHFVDADGEERIRDGGGYYYSDDELTIVSKWVECLGCNYRFTFEVQQRRLSLETSPGARPYTVAGVLASGDWRRAKP